MALTDVQILVLQSEIATDPKGLGYSGKFDPEVADLLNTTGASSETIDVGVLDGQELNQCIVISEYNVLSDAARQGWTTILSAGTGQIDVDNANTRAQIQAIWGPGTDTRANLVALQERLCSRAEALFGRGVSVSHLDVAKAR